MSQDIKQIIREEYLKCAGLEAHFTNPQHFEFVHVLDWASHGGSRRRQLPRTHRRLRKTRRMQSRRK